MPNINFVSALNNSFIATPFRLWFSQTNDTLDVGQDSKRSQNRSKTGVETPKSLIFRQNSNDIGFSSVVNALDLGFIMTFLSLNLITP